MAKGPTWEVRDGGALEVLREMPDESVQCMVTSPPYWGLRDYKAGPGMIGLEPTMGEHLAALVEVFTEARRVLRSDGTLWLNYGDAYASGSSGQSQLAKWGAENARGGGHSDALARTKRGASGCGLAPKQRMLMPARLALALQDSGWWVRSEIVWAKGLSFCDTYAGSCMPSSVRDRPTDSHEMLYLLTKAPRYFYDADALRERPVMKPQRRTARKGRPREARAPGHPPDAGFRQMARAEPGVDANPAGRNVRTVWTINPQPFPGAHFATFPEDLVRPCILAGTSAKGACSECGAPWRRVVERGEPDREQQQACGGNEEGDYTGQARKDYAGALAENASDVKRRVLAGMRKRRTTRWEPTCEHQGAPVRPCVVLDPFCGSGTTGVVALAQRCSFIGIELSADYAAMARRRIGNAAPSLFSQEAPRG